MGDDSKPEKGRDVVYVPDTSAILTGKIDILSMRCVVPSGVIKEIRKGMMGRLMDHEMCVIQIIDPKSAYMEKVKMAARETGDLPYLSQTDMDIIAVALEIGGVIISDDYSLQNVSSKLKIEFQGCGLECIKSRIRWGYVCKGCGAKYEEKVENCRICGHKITRYPLDQEER